jgi:hypothetical protein
MAVSTVIVDRGSRTLRRTDADVRQRLVVDYGGLLTPSGSGTEGLTMRVTRGLRLPRLSTLISPTLSSARSARLFASACTPHSSSIKLETMKVSSPRSPLMCQSANPTSNVLTPSRLA